MLAKPMFRRALERIYRNNNATGINGAQPISHMDSRCTLPHANINDNLWFKLADSIRYPRMVPSPTLNIYGATAVIREGINAAPQLVNQKLAHRLYQTQCPNLGADLLSTSP